MFKFSLAVLFLLGFGRSTMALPGNFSIKLQRRATTLFPTTCGFLDGNPSEPRTANSGFVCRSDPINQLWGFCPSSVISAKDCGLAAACVDSFGCTSGCGVLGLSSLTTFTCSEDSQPFCSDAILTDVNDVSYTYIACGTTAKADHLLAVITAAPASITTSSTSSTSSISTTLSAAGSSSLAKSTAIGSQQSAASISSTGSVQPTSMMQSSISSSSKPSSSSFSSIPSLPTAAAVSSSPTSTPSNAGAIVGGVIGGLALISLVVLAVMFLHRDRLRLGSRIGLDTRPKSSTQSSIIDMPIQKTKRYTLVFKNPWGDNSGPAELPGYRNSVFGGK